MILTFDSLAIIRKVESHLVGQSPMRFSPAILINFSIALQDLLTFSTMLCAFCNEFRNEGLVSKTFLPIEECG